MQASQCTIIVKNLETKETKMTYTPAPHNQHVQLSFSFTTVFFDILHLNDTDPNGRHTHYTKKGQCLQTYVRVP